MVYKTDYLPSEGRTAYFCRRNPDSIVLTLPHTLSIAHNFVIQWLFQNQEFTYSRMIVECPNSTTGSPSPVPYVFWGPNALMYGPYEWLVNRVPNMTSTLIKPDFVESLEESLFE